MTRLIDDAPEGVNTPEFSVSELSGAVKRTVEGAFSHVRVRGEIGRVSRPRSGHVYLDLKDDRAVLSGVIWKGTAGRLATPPEEGMEVIATGRLTTFPGQSKYQIVIEDIAPAGVGALMAMLEKRRKALAAEGLFDTERKKALPFLPMRIGVVTSPSGAVIRDILHRLAERFPVHVLVWPVAVQGAKCAPEVAAAIEGFSAATGALRPDLVIVARGGGSVEDLWGFNEEIVVRAAAACTIPLISAVGHETDTTLIDHVADRRAPTPSAAAEIAVPVRGELAAQIADLEARRLRALDTLVRTRRQRLTDLARALPRPEQILAERRQRLDITALRLPDPARIVSDARTGLGRPADRLGPALTARAAAARLRLARPVARLTPALLTDRTARLSERLTDRAARLSPAMNRATRDAASRLTALARMLGTLSYKGTLARGYAVVRDASGAVLPGPADAGSSIEIEWAGDQRRGATIEGEAAPARKPRAKKTKPAPDQGTLF